MVPMTAEKEKAPVDDKIFIQAKTQEVLEELAGVDGFSELVQKGLKSMTHKQFIMILQHFLKPIVGNVTLDGSNYVEYIHNLLITLDYPYTITKSSLKTPSAPHCQNGIVVLLAWLSEFTVKDTEDDPVLRYSTTDDFDTPEQTKMFMQKTADAFLLWNNQQEAESDNVFKQIRQTYVEQKIRTGADCLDSEIDRLKLSIENLKKEAKPISLQNQYAEKRQALKSLMQQCEEVNDEVKDNLDKIKSMKAELEKKRAAQASVSQELSLFRSKLSHQKMTSEQKTALLVEVTEKKLVLANDKQTVLELAEAGSENEIKLSLLIQKKFRLIGTLNNFIYKLTSDLEVAGWKEEFDPTAYEIKTTKLGEASGLSDEIKHLNQGLIVLKDKYHHTISFNQALIDKLNGEKHQLATDEAISVQELENLQSSIEKISAEETLLETELQDLVHSNAEICNEIVNEIELMDDDIKILNENMMKFHELNPRLAAEQKTFQKASLVKIKEYYNKRKEEVEQHRQQLGEMKQFLSEFSKTNQLFSEEVQKTIDEVIKKRAAEKEDRD